MVQKIISSIDNIYELLNDARNEQTELFKNDVRQGNENIKEIKNTLKYQKY